MATTQAALAQTFWNPNAERLLKDATGDDPTYTIEDLKREVQTGTATLYAVRAVQGGDLIGYFVAWKDEFGDGSGNGDLVLQAGNALIKFEAGLRLALPLIRDLAKQKGCQFIRSHPSNPRMMRALQKVGFKTREYVVAMEA